MTEDEHIAHQREEQRRHDFETKLLDALERYAREIVSLGTRLNSLEMHAEVIDQELGDHTDEHRRLWERVVKLGG